jgi:starch-binding outer membrane protein, SusD/RagB family
MTRTVARLALLGALATGAACSADRLLIPNYNSPTVEGLSKDPNGIQLVSSAMLIQMRASYGGFIDDVGRFGRESYNYFPTDGRTISNYFVGIGSGPTQRLDPTGFASGNWGGYFTNMKNAVNIIDAASNLSATSKAGVAGFAKTVRALALLYVVMTHDTLGSPVDIPADVTVAPAFVSRDSVYKFIIAMLDDAKTNLQAAGTTFPFTMHAGWANFNTPATFLQFNRAIAAKANVLYGSLGCGSACYQKALTALGESFASSVGGATSLADLNRGPTHLYSTASGDVQNGLCFCVNNYYYAHASIVTDAQLKPGGQPDDRLTRKVVALAAPVQPPQSLNIAATQRFLFPSGNGSANSIIRNEELMLLRAEANWATGNTAQALLDVNNIRQVSGGLAALTSLPAGSAGLDIIMYEKRYSTLWEGNRWVDMRRWGRLGQLPIDKPGQFVAKVMPIPQNECDARKGALPRGCEGNL